MRTAEEELSVVIDTKQHTHGKDLFPLVSDHLDLVTFKLSTCAEFFGRIGIKH